MEKKSLASVTQGFMKILTESDPNEVDLTTVRTTLNTTSRRLYDLVNVLAGVGMVERTGKSRVRLIHSCSVDTLALAQKIERERELDHLLEVVDHELTDMCNSELFERCAWIDREDADACEPDLSIGLFALHGPSSMSITIHDDEADPENRTMLCKVENPQDGPILLDTLRRA